MIENLKQNLTDQGFFSVDIGEIFPQFDLNEWLTVLTTSWTQEKATYWTYHNLILGTRLPAEISDEELAARRERVVEEGLIIDQQYWNLDLRLEFFTKSLTNYITAILPELYPIDPEQSYFLNNRVNCLTQGDFIGPQKFEDKVCHIILFISDLDLAAINGGIGTVNGQPIPPKKGTLLLADSINNEIPVSISTVNDSIPRFIFRSTVNLYPKQNP